MTNIEEQILENQIVIMSILYEASNISTDNAKLLNKQIQRTERLINWNENHEF